jgi:type VI secretion system protein ImpA
MPDPSAKPAVDVEASPAEEEDDSPLEARAAARARGGRGLSGGIESREDALRAIDMVCAYLERTEPTNPAQLLLRRARRLVNSNFLQLIRELAPESLQEVARIMGVSADEIPMVSSDD